MIWYQNDVDLAQACLSCSQLRHPLVIKPLWSAQNLSNHALCQRDLGSAARGSSQLCTRLVTSEATYFSGWFKASIQ